MTRLIIILLLLGTVLLPVGSSIAQEVEVSATTANRAKTRGVNAPYSKFDRGMHHVITIEPGRVLLDGIEISDDDLPESFDLSNVTTTLDLTGNSIIELNGTMFQLQDGRIVEASGNENGFYDVMVYFNSTNSPEQSVRVLSPQSTFARGILSEEGPYQVVMKNYVGKLNEKAVEFENIRARMSRDSQSQAQHLVLAEQLRVEAENTARIAGAFPRVEYEGYLRGIHEKDSNLYNRLVQEHNLEMNTHELAMQARSTSDANEREKFAAELRIQLEEIFELKQQNREDEINQLSSRLQDLTELMNKRAALKNRIVESRLKELLGELDW